jgi:hypothetical protein
VLGQLNKPNVKNINRKAKEGLGRAQITASDDLRHCLEQLMAARATSARKKKGENAGVERGEGAVCSDTCGKEGARRHEDRRVGASDSGERKKMNSTRTYGDAQISNTNLLLVSGEGSAPELLAVMKGRRWPWSCLARERVTRLPVGGPYVRVGHSNAWSPPSNPRPIGRRKHVTRQPYHPDFNSR